MSTPVTKQLQPLTDSPKSDERGSGCDCCSGCLNCKRTSGDQGYLTSTRTSLSAVILSGAVPAFAATTTKTYGESLFLPLLDLFGVIPPVNMSMRVSLRQRYGIKDSMFRDCLFATCCSPCSWDHGECLCRPLLDISGLITCAAVVGPPPPLLPPSLLSLIQCWGSNFITARSPEATRAAAPDDCTETRPERPGESALITAQVKMRRGVGGGVVRHTLSDDRPPSKQTALTSPNNGSREQLIGGRRIGEVEIRGQRCTQGRNYLIPP
ncbi:unnamed protein product [Pleuronectes platessa]|uniref:Uncharacterized protein n=1 Tax=Pleuronectes platessa TaxID=8262 RepID=A0A9N7TGX9_PLEPL|nr:unnamed protein product [Pleuronectes platessa]